MYVRNYTFLLYFYFRGIFSLRNRLRHISHTWFHRYHVWHSIVTGITVAFSVRSIPGSIWWYRLPAITNVWSGCRLRGITSTNCPVARVITINRRWLDAMHLVCGLSNGAMMMQRSCDKFEGRSVNFSSNAHRRKNCQKYCTLSNAYTDNMLKFWRAINQTLASIFVDRME